MSCLIASYETISIVANFISRLLDVGYNSFGFESPLEVFEAYADCKDHYGSYNADKICAKLFSRNLCAYKNRYEHQAISCSYVASEECSGTERRHYRLDNSEQGVITMEYVTELPKADIDIWKAPVVKNNSYIAQDWHYRVLKCIQFLEYQLSEDITAKEAQTVALQKLSQVLALFIATHNDIYNSYMWR